MMLRRRLKGAAAPHIELSEINKNSYSQSFIIKVRVDSDALLCGGLLDMGGLLFSAAFIITPLILWCGCLLSAAHFTFLVALNLLFQQSPLVVRVIFRWLVLTLVAVDSPAASFNIKVQTIMICISYQLYHVMLQTRLFNFQFCFSFRRCFSFFCMLLLQMHYSLILIIWMHYLVPS